MRQQITRFENMSNSTTIFFLVKYANALGTEIDVVLKGVELMGWQIMNKYETVKFNNDSVEIDVTVSPLEDTVWLSQEQMALLFNVNVPAVNKHIKNIF